MSFGSVEASSHNQSPKILENVGRALGLLGNVPACGSNLGTACPANGHVQQVHIHDLS